MIIPAWNEEDLEKESSIFGLTIIKFLISLILKFNKFFTWFDSFSNILMSAFFKYSASLNIRFWWVLFCDQLEARKFDCQGESDNPFKGSFKVYALETNWKLEKLEFLNENRGSSSFSGES